jgi:hypothetical protein
LLLAAIPNMVILTEEVFNTTLKEYQSGKFAAHYQTDEQIYDLKYSVGDWKYACFDGDAVLSEDELFEITKNFNDNYDKEQAFFNKLIIFFTEILIDFSKTEYFNKIPKTEAFKIFCVDHDEELKNAEERLNTILSKL